MSVRPKGRRVYTITVIGADERPSTVSKTEEAGVAADLFRDALLGSGRAPDSAEYHLAAWKAAAGQGQALYEVPDPDLNGSTRINIVSIT